MAEKNMQMEQAQEQAGGMKPEKKQTGQSQREIRVGFVGNPNCGKTTLFNAFTGAKLKGGKLARCYGGAGGGRNQL